LYILVIILFDVTLSVQTGIDYTPKFNPFPIIFEFPLWCITPSGYAYGVFLCNELHLHCTIYIEYGKCKTHCCKLYEYFNVIVVTLIDYTKAISQAV